MKRVLNQLTDDAKVDPTVAGGRTPEINTAAVETGVRLPNVINRQTGRLLDRREEGSFAQHLVVRPMAGPCGKFVTGVIPVTKRDIYINTITFQSCRRIGLDSHSMRILFDWLRNGLDVLPFFLSSD